MQLRKVKLKVSLQLKEKAFTLIELMIAVAIIGILAGLATPAFLKYMKKSKTSEAMINIRKIYDGEVNYFQEDHVNIAGDRLESQFVEAGPTPISIPQNTKLTGNWESDEWIAIKFSADAPVFYRYRVTSSGSGIDSAFQAIGEGDLDGDNETSFFERRFTFDRATGEVRGSGGLYKRDSIE